MAKPKRKPQGRPKASSTPRWRGKLSEYWLELVTGGLLVLFVSLWVTEYREHEATKQQLVQERGLRQQAEGGRDQALAERDKLQNGLAELRQENAALRKLHPILEFYGPEAKFLASYDLRKEAGSAITVGRCPQEPCIVLTLLEAIRGLDGTPEIAALRLTGKWAGLEFSGRGVDFGPRIKRGCRSILTAGPYRITFVIEEDQVHSIRVGVGISVVNFQVGTYFDKHECPGDINYLP